MINPNAVLDPLSAAIEPSNDMIVLPFDHAYRNNFGMIPVRTQDDFMLVSPSHYDPERYPPGLLHSIGPTPTILARCLNGGGLFIWRWGLAGLAGKMLSLSSVSRCGKVDCRRVAEVQQQ